MNDEVMSEHRRRLLAATAVTGGAAAVATVFPLVASMSPSERAKAAGAPVQVDISKLKPGQMVVPEWRGKPVFVLRRTSEMIKDLQSSSLQEKLADPLSKKKDQQPAYCNNVNRSIKPDLLVIIGICTHLGCSPTAKPQAGEASGMGADWTGGFFCPCHGSLYDLAGRVYKNMPAPSNLEVPIHSIKDDKELIIGIGQDGKVA